MSGLDKKKVTEYLNRVTHKYDKDGRIMPFQIEYNCEEARKYDGFTQEEKQNVCVLFIKNIGDALFSDVCDVYNFPVLLKDAVFQERASFTTTFISPKNLAPKIDPTTVQSPEAFNDVFMNFISQRDEMIQPKESAPLQLDINGFIDEEDKYGDYQSVFSKETIYTSQIFEVKPKEVPVSYEDAMKRYQSEIANPGGVTVTMTEAEAAAEFNRLMKQKQDAFDAEKVKYTDKIGDNIMELAKARDALVEIPNYDEEERKKALEAMICSQE